MEITGRITYLELLGTQDDNVSYEAETEAVRKAVVEIIHHGIRLDEGGGCGNGGHVEHINDLVHHVRGLEGTVVQRLELPRVYHGQTWRGNVCALKINL